ncbi:ArpU family transcriptional regulator [Paenibacillus marchantiophytorum]|uniref:ArpU family transcriptional regulator n=1 Tax=Paenibacillus marchantiophytorum TaxID=1619310 RepID=A0ABQ2BRN9_9BACL|nr:ArpU family phage packaging/lysis transcriptional regulator [Paenibacillus marchantiophytorum]GGI46005.1 ArpU family transcriptional regulator [Paenibacillus marchantiophytorum]
MMDRIIDIEQADIDQKATRKRVERVLEMVRMYQSIGSMRKDRGVFADFKPAPRAADLRSLNGGDTAADLPSLNELDTAAYLANLCVEVEEVVSRLDEQEQEMIRRRYLQKEKVFDFLLFHELNLSERTYRRVKAKAMSKLAYMMRLEVTGRKKTLEGPQQVGR